MADVKIYKIVDGEKIESFMSEKSWENLPANKRGWLLADNAKKIEIPDEVLALMGQKETAIKPELHPEIDAIIDAEQPEEAEQVEEVKEIKQAEAKQKPIRRRK